MADQADILSAEEVARHLGRLRQADLIRFAALAETWARGLARRDAADLLNEALTRILSGQRPWPAEVPLAAFLSQVMRSIASQWRAEDLREPLASDAGVPEPVQAAAAVDIEMADLADKIRSVLLGDAVALGVFEHILLQSGRGEICAELGLDATGYDTARRRMIRTLQRQLIPGWTS